MDLNDLEAMALVRSHASAIQGWRLTSCDPIVIEQEKAELRSRAERLYGLVLAMLGKPPKPKKPAKLRRRIRVPQKKRRRPRR